MDGRKIFTNWNQNTSGNQWPFKKPYYVIFNFAVGSHFGGNFGVDPNIWLRQMLVDYVRVYKKI
ncbi:MAG: hypothetical protein H7318_17505 [Oligoflexus sp.]|nr:hypothetical protein [Oligoflexus sp.]